MKIAHYVDENRLSWSGPWRQLLLAVGQGAADLEQLIICRPGGILAKQLEQDGFRVITYRPRLPWSPLCCPGFAAILRRTRPDIIHTRLSAAAMIAGFWGKMAGIPVVATVDKYPRGRYYRNASLIVPSSREVADHMRREGFTAERLRVATNAIRVEDYRPDPVAGKRLRRDQGVEDGRLLFLALGRFVTWKGFDLLIQALASLPINQPSELWLVGSGPLQRELEELAATLLGQKPGFRVKFFPFAHDVRPFLRAADIFVQPSYHVPNSGGPETFSLALLEAMAAGLRAVAFNCGGAPDLISDGVDGWLARPGDFLDLAAAIDRAVTTPQLEKIRENAMKKAREHDVVRSAANYLDIYRQALRM